MLSVRDYARVRTAITAGSTVALRTRSYTSSQRDRVDRVLSLYLYELGLVHLHNNLAYCVHELAGNARNALLKRIWFAEQHLDITDRGVYRDYVPVFRHDITRERDRYLGLLERSGYAIRFLFAHSAEQIWITVENNTPLLPIEHERIEEKLAAGRLYRSMADAYAALSDFSEGAGLGIAMVLVILRTLGLPPDSLILGGCSTAEGVTRSVITLERADVGRPRKPIATGGTP